MSLGAELAFAHLASAARGPVALASEHGAASPMVDSAALVVRLASRPLCGLSTRPARAYLRPIDLNAAAAQAGRVATRLPLFIDVRAGVSALDRLNELGGELAAIRALGDFEPPSGLRVVYRDGTGEVAEVVFARDAFIDERILVELARLERGEEDELDRVRALIGHGRAATLDFVPGGGRIGFDPETCVDEPDAVQIAAALGDERAVFAEDGGCELAIPRITASDGRVDVLVRGLARGAPDPEWMVDGAGEAHSRRAGSDWVLSAAIGGVAEFDRVTLRVRDGAGAWIDAVRTEARRRRAGWESWDEAQARLELEESW